jgi:two-component system cell cycle response regulator
MIRMDSVQGARREVTENEPSMPHRRAADRGADSTSGLGSGAAKHLLERRALLDEALRQQDTSAMATILHRLPPTPAALLMIEATTTRERFAKLLSVTNVKLDQADNVEEAVGQLGSRIHALMFTDSLELIHRARQLPSGAATHIVFVHPAGDSVYQDAFRAGANDCLPNDARGEHFWAHLTIARRIADLAASLQLALTDNRILSTIDELTRAGSRRFFEQQFPREVERAARLGQSLALVMCDIDHFKRINDRFGHQCGDDVLREFTDRISGSLRVRQDWIARYGGEEFAVVLPDTPVAEANAVAKRLREVIRATPFPNLPEVTSLTASFGVCALDRVPGECTGLAERIVGAADAALYQSKRRGRNRVTSAQVLDDSTARLPVVSAG